MQEIVAFLLGPLSGQASHLIFILMGLTFIGAFITSSFGIGSGVFMTPLFVFFLPPKLGIALVAVLMMLMSGTGVRQYWRQWDNTHILILLPAGLIGIWVGTHLLAVFPPIYVIKTVGVLAAVFGSFQLLTLDRPEWKNRLRPKTWQGVGLGFGSGIASGMANTGGIVFSFYLLPHSRTKVAFVAGTVLLFFVTGLLKIGTFLAYGLLNGPILLLSLLLVPGLILGSILGKRLNNRIPAKLFIRVLSIFIVLMGIRLIWG